MDLFMQFVAAHWLLCSAFGVILVLLIQSEYNALQGDVTPLSPQEVVLKLNKQAAVLIDVRESAQYQKGHIQGARNIPAKEVATSIPKFKKLEKKPLILVGANTAQVAAVAGTLKKEKIEGLFALKGGLEAWKSEDLPLSKG